jgi:UDP-N-acetylglucosamine 2-epimerase (non-hydrolysing)
MYFVGSVNIDTLLRYRARALGSSILADLQLNFGSEVRPFVLLTLQHLSGQEGAAKLRRLQKALSAIAQHVPTILPATASALRCIQDANLEDYFVDHFRDGPEPWDARVRIRLIPPLGYLDFVKLMGTARIVITDSTGVQEETRVLGVPCISVPDSGTVPEALEGLVKALRRSQSEAILAARYGAAKQSDPAGVPTGWDGRAAQRLIQILLDDFGPRRRTRGPNWTNSNGDH